MGRPLGIQGSEIKVSLPKVVVLLFIDSANETVWWSPIQRGCIHIVPPLPHKACELGPLIISQYLQCPSSANEDSRVQLLHSSLEAQKEWNNSMPAEMKAENCRDEAPFWLHRQCARLLLCKPTTRFGLIGRVQYDHQPNVLSNDLFHPPDYFPTMIYNFILHPIPRTGCYCQLTFPILLDSDPWIWLALFNRLSINFHAHTF